MCLDCACGLPDVPVHEPNDAIHDHGIERIGDAEPAKARRQLALGEQLLSHNASHAAANRARFEAAGVRVVNLLSSPGSGKTALLERLARDGGSRLAMAVVVGDLATDNDARRLRAAGLPAVQITTGQACHLEATMVQRGVHELAHAGVALADLDLLLIENVGNLVCPAAYDLGEILRVVLLSVTEGEDKPLKYPATFHSADLVLIGKIDLSEATGFDRALARRNVERVAPNARILEVSARSGAGMEELLHSLKTLDR
jgi:hydrogenase nickel incorporation protein HypB